MVRLRMMGGLMTWEVKSLVFIPASVSIVNYADIVREHLLALLVICTVSTAVTFAAAAGAVRLTCRLLERGKRS